MLRKPRTPPRSTPGTSSGRGRAPVARIRWSNGAAPPEESSTRFEREVDAQGLFAEAQIDVVVAIKLLGAQRQAGEVHIPLEKRLRQRRALVGQFRFAGEQDDLVRAALFAQARGGLNARVTGSDDDDRAA